jgi:hypothetical protein
VEHEARGLADRLSLPGDFEVLAAAITNTRTVPSGPVTSMPPGCARVGFSIELYAKEAKPVTRLLAHRP